jgi:hypothetical protein
MNDQATERDDALVEPEITIAEDAMLDGLMGICLQEIKAAPEVWTMLSEQEQDDIIGRVEKACRDAIRKATRIIESEGRDHAFARVEYVKFKDGEATAVLKGIADEHMHTIADSTGPILLILSRNDRDGETHTHEPDKPQGGLDLESGASGDPASRDPGQDEPDAGDAEAGLEE